MSYLDPKERVIDLQLTSYGKYLLSIGKLDPVYYAFFDDDVIYDAQYASVAETQSEVEPRIQEGTPRFSVQTVFSGRELEIFNKNPNVYNDLIIGNELEDEEKIVDGLIKIQDGSEHDEVLQQPIGKSNPFYDYAPAWNVKFFKAEMSASVDYKSISGSRGEQILNIPQLEANIKYRVYRNSHTAIKEGTARVPNDNFGNAGGFALAVGDVQSVNQINFSDGSEILVEPDGIVLQIEESNTFFENENFDIEFFEIQTVSGKENLKPLRFYTDGDMLSDARAGEEEYINNTVEQYFTFDIDKEIDESIICPLIKVDKTPNIFISKMFDCEDIIKETNSQNIYDGVDDTKDICE